MYLGDLCLHLFLFSTHECNPGSSAEWVEEEGGGGYSINLWVGVCQWDIETLTLC